jgi:pimeloyl-ACP methyl ester carboxylesterase
VRRFGWLVLLAACTGDGSGDDPFGDGDAGQPLFDVAGDFWDAPFPSDHRVRDDTRRVDISGFPAPVGVRIVEQTKALLDDQVQGWSLAGAVYLPVDRGVDPAHLPDLAGSVKRDATVFLVDVDRESPHVGERHPIEVAVRDYADGIGPPHAIVALPLQGLPLAPRTRYALVASTELFDVDQHTLAPSPAVAALARGEGPEGWRADVRDQYLDAVAVLGEQGVELDRIAGLTVFTTGRPTRDIDHVFDAAQQLGGMRILVNPTIQSTESPDFCVYEGTFDVPDFQSGTPPFTNDGGTFVFDEDRVPRAFPDPGCGAVPHDGRACGHFTVTVPRNAGLPETFPVVVFVRTGAGGDQPLVNRGPHTEPGVDVPLTGYAGTFARAGWAAVQFDGPLGGPLRNPQGADEQFLIFNVNNPGGMRDTLRQSAVELALVPDLLDKLYLAASTCPGMPDIISRKYMRFASDGLVLFGHSMGATIAPVAAALQPKYRGLLLSGAGGSWIENVVHKQKPVEVAPLAATLLGVDVDALDAFHPALTLVQWAGEPADTPMYASLLDREEPDDRPHVLMMQGLVDHYILPPIANAESLALGLDLGGDALDVELAPTYRSFTEVSAFRGARSIPLPTGLNRAAGPDRSVTRILVQHEEDGLEDGHEVVFQESWPHQQVSCFLQGMVDDRPLVAPLGDEGAPCPLPPEE